MSHIINNITFPKSIDAKDYAVATTTDDQIIYIPKTVFDKTVKSADNITPKYSWTDDGLPSGAVWYFSDNKIIYGGQKIGQVSVSEEWLKEHTTKNGDIYTLNADADIVQIESGGKYRLPTCDEVKELFSYTSDNKTYATSESKIVNSVLKRQYISSGSTNTDDINSNLYISAVRYPQIYTSAAIALTLNGTTYSLSDSEDDYYDDIISEKITSLKIPSSKYYYILKIYPSLDTSEMTSFSEMFRYQNFRYLYVQHMRNDSCTNVSYFASNCYYLEYLRADNLVTEKCTNAEGFCSNNHSVYSVYVQGWDTSGAPNLNKIFYNCPNLYYIEFGSNWGKETSSNTLDLSISGNNYYSKDTFDSMLTMYDRASAGYTTTYTITLLSNQFPSDYTEDNINNFVEKMAARGYTVEIK